MTTYGDSDFFVRISTGNSGGVPSGDIIYLEADDVELNKESLSKVKPLPKAGSYSTRLGKKENRLTIHVSIITKYSGMSTLTQAVNNITAQLEKQMNSGAGLYYAWVYNRLDSDYVGLMLDDTGTQYDYILGVIKKFSVKWKGGYFTVSAIDIIECKQ